MAMFGLRRHITGYTFVLPSLVFFVLFTFYPAVQSVMMSLYEFFGATRVWVGFDNYVAIFQDEKFIKALGNTFLYVLYIVPATIAFSLWIGWLIYGMRERWTSMFRAVFYFPTITSAVAISLVWGWIFSSSGSGLANQIMKAVGAQSQIWFMDESMALLLVVFVILTVSVGQPIILFTAAMGGIPSDYYEAATVDGAGRWQQFVRITLPLLMPTTLYCVVITTINAFQTFIFIHLLTSGGPNNSSTSIIYQLYDEAFRYNSFGTASSMGVVLFFLVSIVAFFQFKTMTSKVEY